MDPTSSIPLVTMELAVACGELGGDLEFDIGFGDKGTSKYQRKSFLV